MSIKIKLNDAWEGVPLGCATEIIEYFEFKLQPTHPLRPYKLFPIAKCWRREKYLVERQEPNDLLVLDLESKRRIRGKTCFDFKVIESQEQLDEMLKADYEAWVQYMKDAGSWFGD